MLFLVFVPAFSQDKILDMSGAWKFSIGDRSDWSSPAYNDNLWENLNVPGNWEDQGFHGYDGYAWYRKKIDGTKLPKGENLYLHLGYVDDVDQVYFNGRMIGFSGYFPPKFKTAHNAERIYVLPSQYINYEGDNLIAIRIFDVVGTGGIVAGNIGIYSSPYKSSLLLDLHGLWSFKQGVHLDGNGLNWNEIMVPIPWESQGYDNYDGYATYKKVFKAPANLDSDNLVLLMGRIDDFDKTYLNGRLLGETNDNRWFGESSSYNVMRVYEIPEGLLVPGEMNIITVEVEDLGISGGIWQGPVGITTKTRYYHYFK